VESGWDTENSDDLFWNWTILKNSTVSITSNLELNHFKKQYSQYNIQMLKSYFCSFVFL
jgi:hypothetical protein